MHFGSGFFDRFNFSETRNVLSKYVKMHKKWLKKMRMKIAIVGMIPHK